MSKLNRRKFLKNSALTVASASLWSLLPGCKTGSARQCCAPGVKQRVIGANEDVRIALVGLHGRGKQHIDNFSKAKGVRVVALCDVDTAVLAGFQERYKDKLVDVKDTYTDYRKLLENKDIDAVALATPNHWHALGGIWAAQAGKDSYVEKPASHNVWEGGKLVEAARKYNRIVQTGSQSRSSFAIKEGIEWVKAGNLGKILRIRGLCYNRRDSIGLATGPLQVPSTVDYDQWCGPAPLEQKPRVQFHYDWHWFWSTGNGDLGNQGVHQTDVARWAGGYGELPTAVLSLGGRVGYKDDAETPNTQITYYDYQPYPIIYEVRGLPQKTGAKEMDKYHGQRGVSVVLECEGGWLTVPNYVSAIAFDNDDKEIKRFEGAESHYENFIKAVRSRNRADLNAEIEEGHLSAALCHLANISQRLGKPESPEEDKAAIKDNALLTDAFDRMATHLDANGVDISKDLITLGAPLQMDPKAVKFVGSPEANKMLTREYRKPYVVPEKV